MSHSGVLYIFEQRWGPKRREAGVTYPPTPPLFHWAYQWQAS